MKYDIQKIRKELEERRAILYDHMDIGTGKEQVSQTMNPDRADLAQRYSSRERKAALEERMEINLKKIEDALQRLEDGTYGVCLRCGEDISLDRLEALPYVDLCIKCQRKEEKRRL